jgi:hypothetical protein
MPQNQQSPLRMQTISILAGGLGDSLQQFAFLISQITDLPTSLDN